MIRCLLGLLLLVALCCVRPALGQTAAGNPLLIHVEPARDGGTLLRWQWMDDGPFVWRLWRLNGNDQTQLLSEGVWKEDAPATEQSWIEWRDVVEPNATEAVYLLEWAGEDGDSQYHGPFRCDSPSSIALENRGPYSKPDSKSAIASAGVQKELLPASSILLTLTTPTSGPHRIRATDVSGVLGVSDAVVRDWFRSAKLQVLSGGVPVAWLPDPAGDNAWVYVPEVETTYFRGGVLQLAGLPGVILPERGAMPPLGQVGDSHGWVERRHERDLVAVPTAPGEVDDEFWFWLNLVPGHPVLGRREFDFPLGRPSPVGSLVRIELDCVSTSSAQHQVRILVNGHLATVSEWVGRERRHIEVEVPAEWVREGVNQLVLESVGHRTSLLYLDRFTTRSLEAITANSDGAMFTTWKAGVVSIGGWSVSGIECWDVTQPLHPVRMTGIEWQNTGAGWTARLYVESGRRLAWFHPDRVPTFASMRMVQGRNLEDWLDGAQHVVVGPSVFEEAAGELVSWREMAEVSSRFIPLEAVHDHFSHGNPDPRALLGFVKALEGLRSPPRYLVLVGNGNYDYRNVLGLGPNRMPPLLAMTPLGRFPADTRLAERGDNRNWELAVGRIPVASPTAFLKWMEKLKQSERALPDSPARYLLMAAQPDPAGQFIADSEVLRRIVPSEHSVATLYDTTGNIDVMRSELRSALQSGPLIWNYAGHGSRDRLGNGYLLSTDVTSLPATSIPPVLAALTCGAGHFGVPGFSAIASDLLLRENGGVIAAWSPSGFSQNASARLLNQSLFRALAAAESDAMIGDIILEAVADYRLSRGDPDLPQLYNVLGDPAMPLRLQAVDSTSRPHIAIEWISPGRIRLHWAGGRPPFQVERADLNDPLSWTILQETDERSLELESALEGRLFRVKLAE
jgi:hypothetical protein